MRFINVYFFGRLTHLYALNLTYEIQSLKQANYGIVCLKYVTDVKKLKTHLKHCYFLMVIMLNL